MWMRQSRVWGRLRSVYPNLKSPGRRYQYLSSSKDDVMWINASDNSKAAFFHHTPPKLPPSNKHHPSFIPEMQKVADAADISLLFFSAGVNFWAIWVMFGPFWQFGSFLGQFGQFLVIFGLFWVIWGHFWAIFWCYFCVAKYATLDLHVRPKAFILNKLWRGLALIFPRCNILLFVIERYPCQSSHIPAHYRTILTFIVQHGGWFGHCPNLREVVFIFLRQRTRVK